MDKKLDIQKKDVYLSIPVTQLYQRVKCVDLNHQLKIDFLNLFLKWLECNGPEWTVARMKDIKNEVLHYASMNPDYHITSKWLARNKKDKTLLAGVPGALMKLSRKSDYHLGQVVALVNIYTAVVTPDVLPSGELKVLKSVTDEGPAVPEKYLQLMVKAGTKFKNVPKVKPTVSLLHRNRGKDSHENRMFQEVLDFFSTSAGRTALIEHTEVVYPVVSDVLPHGRRMGLSEPTIGSVCCTLSPALKHRYFAAPHIWVQQVTEPLGDVLYDMVRRLPWDCTFDQEKGFPVVQDQLTKGGRAYCYDLSSATDRFPFELQTTLIESIFKHDELALKQIDFLKFIVNQHWTFYPFHIDQTDLNIINGKADKEKNVYYYTNKTVQTEHPNPFSELPTHKIKWRHGQPLGLYPSFALFTLTHGTLLWALNGFRHDNKFFVLGDDVIILDQELAQAYAQALLDTGTPFQMDKTLTSNRFGEFAGRIILKNTVIGSRKWRPIRGHNAFEFLENWGAQYKRCVKESKHPLFDKLASLPEPWGLGWNPQGLSLDERLAGIEEMLLDTERPKEYLASIRELSLDRLRSVREYKYWSRNLAKILQATDDFDQKSFDEFGKLLPLSYDLFVSSGGKNLGEVYEDLNLQLTNRPSSKWTPNKVNKLHQSLMKLDALMLAKSDSSMGS